MIRASCKSHINARSLGHNAKLHFSSQELLQPPDLFSCHLLKIWNRPAILKYGLI